MNNYEHKALLYAEEYGVIEYEVVGNEMHYSKNYYGEGLYEIVVNLDTLKETRNKKKEVD